MTNDYAIPGDRDAASVLKTLRALLPKRQLRLFEAMRLAELQANRLLELRGMAEDVPVDSSVIAGLPRIEIEYDTDMPCSGASDWHSQRRVWVITINALEPETRQRLSLLHEYKHIIDHGSAGLADTGDRTYYGHNATEYLAEYFAGCVLMPKRLVRRAWVEGIQRTNELADLFDVSPRAMSVRLSQLRLAEGAHYQRALCSGRLQSRSSARWGRGYQRAFSPTRPAEVEPGR